MTPLHKLCAWNCTALVEPLLALRHFDDGQLTARAAGSTPLHLCVQMGADSVAKALLSAVSDVQRQAMLSARDDEQQTPFELARAAGVADAQFSFLNNAQQCK